MDFILNIKNEILNIPFFVFKARNKKINLLKTENYNSEHSNQLSGKCVETLFPGECDIKLGVIKCYETHKPLKTQPVCVKCLKLNIDYASATFHYIAPDVITVHIEEITGEKSLDNNLAQSEKFFETVFKKSPLGIVLFDENFNFINVNKAFENILGYTLTELKRIKLKGILEKKCLIPFYRNIVKTRRAEIESFIIENNFISKNRNYVRANLKVSAVFNNNNALQYAIAMFEDITERKKLQDRLEENESRYKAVLQGQSELICRWEKNGRFTFANHAFLRFHGLAKQDIIRQKYYEFLSGNFSILRKIFETRSDLQNVEIKLKINKQDVWVNWTVLKITQNRVLEFQAVGRDITGRKVAENKLKQANIELERRVDLRTTDLIKSNKRLEKEIAERIQAEEDKRKLNEQFLQAQKMEALGVLAGGVAHDFNNLLNVINGYTQMLMWDSQENEETLADLKEIQDAAFRAARLTHQLLVFSRQEKLKKIPVYINAKIYEIMKMASRIIGEDIKILLELDKKINRILADPGNIEQVLMNLLVNARDAMLDGGEIKIKTYNQKLESDYSDLTSYSHPGEYVCLEITDNGKGMDKETQNRIFEPFFTTKPQNKGTGLGLSVVYGIIREHEGVVDVQSQKGKGTSFRLFFPAIKIKDKQKHSEQEAINKYRGNNERILLIEDEKALLKINSRVLNQNGYLTYLAESGEQAKNVFYQNNMEFDLIFSDVVLPDTNGLALTGEFIKAAPGMKILLSSGYTGDKARFNEIQEKNIRFMQKPYSLIDLFKNIREIIDDVDNES